MNEIKKLSKSFDETLKNTDLQNVTVNIAETFTDSVLNDGILKDIPIIGTVVGLTKTAFSINDRIFIKKLISFLTELKEIPNEKRNEMISKIDESGKYRIKVGEKLLFILDKCSDNQSARYIALIFNAFLKEELDYSEFLRASSIVEKIFIEDFEYFLMTEIKDLEKTISSHQDTVSDVENSLINSTLCAMVTEEIRVEDQDDYKMSNKYVVEGGENTIYLTDIGYKLKKVIKYSR